MKRLPAGIPILCMVLLSTWLLTACDSDNGLVPPPQGPPPEPIELALIEVADGFNNPVHITHAGDGSDRLFVVERAGRVRTIDDGAVQPTAFLDIGDVVLSNALERGLLSIAFPPGFSDEGHFYVYYTSVQRGTITAGDTIVSRFTVSGDVADPSTEEIILHVPQPSFTNHNGGQLAFGPDGYLYIALGDGGSGGDPQGHGQNLTTLLGTMLRLDVESGGIDSYLIPSGNPFVGNPDAREEIWAWGLRNPWRFSFDRETGDLYIGDVGQGRYEEINFQPADSAGGENYGWNIMEGFHCYSPMTGCDQTGLTLPVAEYLISGTSDCAVTGGFVYRGSEHPDLNGLYLYGDHCSGRIRGFRIGEDGEAQDPVIHDSGGLRISTFGEDEAGNLYLADYFSGSIYRIEAP